MEIKSHYYKCSPEYLNSISPNLEKDINHILNKMPERKDSKSLLNDLFWLLASNGWSFSETPAELKNTPPENLRLSLSVETIIESNKPEFCKSSSNLDIDSKSDFAKKYDGQLVQMEIQTDDLKEIASDLIKFRIAFAEKKIQVGIEIIIQNENEPAAFENVKAMLVKLDVDCPVWVIGIG